MDLFCKPARTDPIVTTMNILGEVLKVASQPSVPGTTSEPMILRHTVIPFYSGFGKREPARTARR